MRHTLAMALTVFVGIPVARAQVAPPPPSDPGSDPTQQPGFVTMDRMDATSRVGLEASYLFIGGNSGLGNNGVTVMRFDPHGQYQIPDTRFGLYATIPITYASGSGNSYTDVLDPELGGMWSSRPSPFGDGGTIAVIVHAGLTLPLASTDGNKFVTGAIGGYTRLDDYYLVLPDATSLRIGVSPVFRRGQLFLRADLGADVNIWHASNMNNVNDFLRVNIGAGVDFGQAALMIESVNFNSGGGGTGANAGFGASWIDVGSISARIRAGSVQPYAAITFPLDNASNKIIDTVATIGVEATVE